MNSETPFPCMRYARLKPGCRAYPSIERDTVYRVLRDEEPEGMWIEGGGIGDPFLSPNARFVFRRFFDVTES